MTRLHQLLPLEKLTRENTDRALAEAKSGLGRADWFTGLRRTYQPLDDQGVQLPGESKIVQAKATDVLDLVAANVARLLDITATKEWANTGARADVKVRGRVLVADAPVGYLLFLEKQIAGWEALVKAVPTLDPATPWSRDETTAGLWKSDGVQTTRTQKVMTPVVMYEATDRHPAQVKEVTKDVVDGFWTTVTFSGALPADQVRGMLERLSELRAAVLHAREEANSVEVVDQHVGSAVIAFVFSGAV